MATPDGISTRDWDQVQAIALDLLDAILRQDDASQEEHRARLLREIDRLEGKYGERPSLLATRADFTEDPAVAEPLLLRAYALAEGRDDARNALYVSHSLAGLYVEDLRDAARGRLWTKRLGKWSSRCDDGWFAEEHARLRDALGETAPPSKPG
jgi:hypothetical protein